MLTASSRPQLNLDELRRLKWLLGGLLALLSLWTVFFLDVEALWLVAGASAAVAAAVVWPALPARVPTLVWKLAVPAIVVAVAVDFYRSPDTLPVLVRLAILLVLYRALAYRRKREDLQLIVLGLFLIVVAGVLTVSLGFAVLLLAFTACALGFLFVVTLVDMVDTGPRVMRPEEMREVPAWARGGWRRLLGRLRRAADWRMLGFGAALFAGVVVISGLLFLLIPRFELASGFFLDRYITRKSRTGFTESVRFGDVTELVRDESVAMRVDLTEAGSLTERPYWRLLVMDEYTPQGFRLSAGLKRELARSENLQQVVRGRTGAVRARETVGGTWTFYVEPGVSRFLPLPGGFSLLRLRDRVPVQSHPASRLVALRTDPVAMTAFQLEGVAFTPTVTDRSFARLLAAAESAGAEEATRGYDPRLMLRGPAGPGNATVLARLVGEITGGEALSALAFAERATAWLQAKHAYALAAAIPRGEGDDIVKWLDSAEPGFCEYFAGGLAVLCRAAGHPARVVAGFRGGALNTYENYFMVRNADAHAWTEVFDGEGAWVRFDPTPGANSIQQAGGPARVERQEQDSSWSARFDSLRVLWYRRVVSFDSRQQVEMVTAVKTFTEDTGSVLRERLAGWAKRLKAWIKGPWDWARAGRVAGVAAAALGASWALWRLSQVWREGRWRRRNADGRPDPVRREAARWLGRLVEEAAARPEARAEAAAVRAELLRLRFGRRETWPEPRRVFQRARAARRALRR